MKVAGLVLVVLLNAGSLFAQDATTLLQKVRVKLEKVNDYKGRAKLKTDVSFVKIPESDVEVLFKKPDRFKIKKEGGISLLPKGGINFNFSSLLLSDQYTAVAAGDTKFENLPVKIIKLLPLDEKSDIV